MVIRGIGVLADVGPEGSGKLGVAGAFKVSGSL
jgi:hypothetical protein